MGTTGRPAECRDGQAGRKSIDLNRGNNQMEGMGRNTRTVNIGEKYTESVSEWRVRNVDKQKKTKQVEKEIWEQKQKNK